MIIYIDIDNTIFDTNTTNYNDSKPNLYLINIANDLYRNGHTITYWTARGSVTGINWYDLTKKQLDESGVLYHELKMGKPAYDLLIDDKSVNNLLEVRNLKSIF
jgi:CMP-N,N'-diacetyllegionaminic acid synthase